MKPFPLFRLTRPAVTTALICAGSVGIGIALAFGIPELAQAQTAAAPATMVIYPAKGQTPKQQDRDKYECHDWARGQSGFDPTQASQPAAPTGTQNPATVGTPTSTGALAKGAVRGAAIGELASNDAGRGAAVGAVGASAMERIKAQQMAQARQQQAAQQQQQQAQRSQQRVTYERAFGVCMEARGYAVK